MPLLRISCGLVALHLALSSIACSAQAREVAPAEAAPAVSAAAPRLLHEVFVSDESVYARKADSAFAKLTDAQRVAQLIVTTGGRLGKSQVDIRRLVGEGVVGGVIYLANEYEDHRAQVADVRAAEQAAGVPVPFWYSIDAEPSLMYRRIIGGPNVTPAADMTSDAEAARVATTIDSVLHDLGYHWNFAPVIDLGTENAAIKNRSFGFSSDTVASRAIAFVEATQAGGVMACIKHFPGHGLVEGDTHKGSVFVDGEMEEYGVYEAVLAEADPLSLMVGHITVRNNEYATDELPASLSRRISHDLVRDKLGYPGIVVTDALNMMAAATKYGPEAPLMASKAGADVILMPQDERLVHEQITAAMAEDEAYRTQVYESVDRVLRAKAWLGLY